MTAQFVGGKLSTLVGLAAFAAIAYLNITTLRMCLVKCATAPFFCKAAVFLCAANIVIMGVQAQRQGMHSLGVVSQVVLGMALVAVVCIYLFRDDVPGLSGLLVIAVGIVLLAGANLVAEKIGVAKDELLDRTELYTSNFAEGRLRWQSPLISSWQLSGLIRWAVPVLFVYVLSGFGMSVTSRFFLFACTVLGTYVAILCEYRAALIPLLGAVVWLIAWRPGLRNALSLCFITYPVFALFLFTGDESYNVLQRVVPEQLYVLTGSQSIEGVLSLSGRSDMWTAGLEGLASGKQLLLGVGHFGIDARDLGVDSGGSLFKAVITRISFHNALLDHLYIYGVSIGMVLLTVFAVGVWRLFVLANTEMIPTQGEILSFGLFTLGILALANCHDGFFTSHNILYLVVATAFRLAEPMAKTRAGYATGPRPQYQ